MPEPCAAKGCKAAVPAGLVPVHMCILHFTLFIEQECAEMRRETALGPVVSRTAGRVHGKDRVDRGEMLVNVAMSGFPMSDELKARILSTLLTLMNMPREHGPRGDAAIRAAPFRRLKFPERFRKSPDFLYALM